MSEVTQLSNVELIAMYEEVSTLMREGKSRQCKLRDELVRRIEVNSGSLTAGSKKVTMTEYATTRTASIEDIRADLVDKFVDANLPVLTKSSTARRIKIDRVIRHRSNRVRTTK